MRGTTYAVSEIIWWMLAAAVIGFLIGWILRRWFSGGKRLKEVVAELDDTSSRIAQLSEELGEWKVKAESLQNDLEARSGEPESATGHTGELDATSAELRDATASGAAELSELRVAHAECGVVAEQNAGRIAGLRAALAERDERIATLEAAATAAESGASPAGAVSAADFQASREAAGVTGMAAGAAAVPAVPPPTRFGTPGADHTDDLKVINGIGPEIEVLLNGFGIRSWEQLAGLTGEDIVDVDAALTDFPGRIERDQWVEQATDLVARFPDPAQRPDRNQLREEPPS